MGQDFERAPEGFVDYVLLNADGRAVAVVEAKRESIDPLTAKEQARAYAETLNASHIFLSNGLVHWYWNLNPTTFDARTDITTQMLSDEGYTVIVPAADDTEESELVFGKRIMSESFSPTKRT